MYLIYKAPKPKVIALRHISEPKVNAVKQTRESAVDKMLLGGAAIFLTQAADSAK